MNSSISRAFDRRVGYVVAAFALLLATLLPTMAFADVVGDRSIALSNSSAEATGVSYQVQFTPVADAGAGVIEFCSDSPVIGATCTAPVGMTAASAATTTSGFAVTAATANKITFTGTIEEPTPVNVTFTGITNPTAADPIYARILTYVDGTAANAYTSTSVGAKIDEGGVAIAITDTIGVSGAVMETLAFCVFGGPIPEDCGADTLPENMPAKPVVTLGEAVGTQKALQSSAVSTGSVYTQISTNASQGAIINLKSDAAGCGGLLRFGSTDCDILPALTGGITAGEAKFGLLTSTASATPAVTTADGDLLPYPSSNYNNSTYTLNYDDTDATGVTSDAGDPILYTNGAPVNNMNMQLTFGASVTNTTPAGLYSADLNLIATGKF